MRTNRTSDAVLRRKKYDLIKNSDRCVCGTYKMRGAAFCRTCTTSIPGSLRARLATSSPLTWPDAYDAASLAIADNFETAEKAVAHG